MDPLNLPRFAVTYQIGFRQYEISMRSFNASHIWRSWDRKRAVLKSVIEVDSNNLPV